MKNYITFPSQHVTPHDAVLSTDFLTGEIQVDPLYNDNFALKTTIPTGAEVVIEHTADATLQAEFANNIRKALIAKPGVGKVPVQLPEGFEVTFVEFG
jgi:hypothetical protein